ncbi:MAG: accessory gene regulator B family protein [Thomasclavelia sp.]
MENISSKIASYLLKGKSASDDELDEIRFGIELVITQSVLLIIIFTIGLFLGRLVETIIFLIVMVSLRTIVDGYHADSFGSCMFLTTMAYVLCMFIYQRLNIYIMIFMMLYAAKAFFFQKSSLLERNILRSKVLFIIYLLLIILTYYKNSMISFLIGFTVFMTSFSMEVKKYNDKRKGLQSN